MKFGLIMRAYAPFKVFGGIFHGDNRGPTTSDKVTSRLKAWVDFDPVAGTIGSAHAKSDMSSTVVVPYRGTGVPMTRVSVATVGKQTIYLKLHASGANPLVPGSSNIDMVLGITANVTSNSLNVQADLGGDQFPNVEVMLQDEGGNRRMLFTYETDAGAHSGPFARLPGSAPLPMNGISARFALTPEGRFQ